MNGPRWVAKTAWMSCASQRLRYGRGGMSGELGGPKEHIVTIKTKDFFSLAMLCQEGSPEGCRKLHLQLRIYILQPM